VSNAVILHVLCPDGSAKVLISISNAQNQMILLRPTETDGRRKYRRLVLGPLEVLLLRIRSVNLSGLPGRTLLYLTETIWGVGRGKFRTRGNDMKLKFQVVRMTQNYLMKEERHATLTL
jgi:hypothetical protein